MDEIFSERQNVTPTCIIRNIIEDKVVVAVGHDDYNFGEFFMETKIYSFLEYL